MKCRVILPIIAEYCLLHQYELTYCMITDLEPRLLLAIEKSNIKTVPVLFVMDEEGNILQLLGGYELEKDLKNFKK